ncbi:histone-lysine N-methyltransferase ASHR1 isoform X1 [Cucumis melo var. makuwa]|uniref:Histone-lysine N-methyltransferase ASHR1 isoform X1 n=1 Tax=Cucumis melo var. makuwa TaxID=1194695 RepID=A0A5A7V3K7_CUCMM|nr:histone-lysine N-methyltransferase ASHR1 isoform X1 [Cucumis melo var. makuwa]TYK10822.1 histone-lysine N-methyltransferase ASHR1 isoform X1 [Cucumis melo var. makuwa]
MIKGKTTMEEVPEGSSSKIASMIDASELIVMGGKSEEKHTKLEGDDSAGDRSKFKKIEMLVFMGADLDSWANKLESFK